MKTGELLNLLNGFESVKDLKGVKFAYAIAKNKSLIQKEFKLLNEVTKPSKKLNDYENKRVELCIKYCKKDKEGKPVIKNNVYEGIKENKEFEKQLETLKTEFKKVIDDRKKQIVEYNKLLDEETTIDLYKVLLVNVPADITPQQLESIMAIVKDENHKS